MPSKKKNAKDSGGTVAAVTKLAAGKFSSSSGNPQTLASSPSPPSGPSPELRAHTPSSNGNPTDSPALDAVSTTSLATSANPNMNEWSRGLPGIAGSPGNLISLTGESPPTQPSSYEDTRGLPHGWQSPRPYLNSHPVSASPPSASARRPLSVQMEGQYKPPELPSSIAHPAVRRSSLHSHFAQSRGGGQHPPLPHQPQAHFYTTPEVDFDLHPQVGMKAGQKGYYFGFDSLPGLHGDRGLGKNTVILAGYEGGLEVYSVAKRGLDHVASLTGIRGGVHHAKILPWVSETKGVDSWPVIAVVVHGPVLASPDCEELIEPGRAATPVSVPPGSPRSVTLRFDLTQRQAGDKTSAASPEFYQTSVELYSLKTNQKLGTLLEAPKIQLTVPLMSPIFQAPPPSGAFQIKADAGTVVVSSGVTGECWIFRQAFHLEDNGLQFTCLGKIWTTIPAPIKNEAASENEPSRTTVPPRPRSQSAIVAVNGRWIAYCPAAPSSQVSLRAVVLVPAVGKAPGLLSMTPPQLPPINSDVDLPLSESMVNKLMRDATQEVIQGAKWIGQQGLQAWNSYWIGPAQPAQSVARSPTLPSQGYGGNFSPRPEQAQFPPTHGSPAPAVYKDPGLISILEIDSVPNSASLHPVVSFGAPLGCSFVSFAPTGLSLFTASSKGDVQNIWDLMRIQYTKSSPLQPSGAATADHGPRVRQIANYSRMTVARVVDVSWTKPNGERLAMITERGTVHLLDLPSSAFTWPPPRRRGRPSATAKGAATGSDGTGSTMAMATTALNSAIEAARPLLDRSRRSSGGNTAQMAKSSIVDHASHGGKVIVAGISHSLGKTGTAISQLRHTGENRVSLPSTTMPPGPACVVWINGRKQQHLFVLGDGLVRTFPNRIRKLPTGLDQRRTPHLTRFKDFKVPPLPDDTMAPAVRQFADPEGFLDLTERELDTGNHTLTLDRPVVVRSDVDSAADSSIPQAEIESSAPYQPFHTDRRVALYEYADATAERNRAPELPTMSVLLAGPPKKGNKTKVPVSTPSKQTREAAWAFGLPIEVTKLDVGLPSMTEDDTYSGDALGLMDSRALPASAMERILLHAGGDNEEDQIVVTTRRRRGAGRAGELDEDGFFEDDCEVLDFADQRV